MPEKLWASLLVVLVMIVIGLWNRKGRRQGLDRAFADVSFQTPAGAVRGKDMRVVKDVFDSPLGEKIPTGAHRYCVGPGPSYFVAICQATGYTWRKQPILGWVVRPLTAERMRHALAGDDEALRAAFGDVVHDRLHA